MSWLAAALGLVLVAAGCGILEHRRVSAHLLAGVLFVAAGLLFMLPLVLP